MSAQRILKVAPRSVTGSLTPSSGPATLAALSPGLNASQALWSLRDSISPASRGPASVKTITTDNGSEFARHQWLDSALGCTSYFCTSYASWERGSN